MKKISTLFLILLIFSNCGYAPIYSNKNLNFNLTDVVTAKNNKLNIRIERYLKKLSNNESQKKIFIKIDSEKQVKTISKDAKGDSSRYEMTIKVKLDIIVNQDKQIKKEFKQKFNYNTNPNNFKLNEYQKEIEELLINKIIEDLIRYLSKI